MGSNRAIMEDAVREVLEEEHRAAVEAEKLRIRERRGRPWWVRLFPYRITIKRID